VNDELLEVERWVFRGECGHRDRSSCTPEDVDPGRIDFNRVAMFVHIASAGGVTAAATQLKVPKSSVSRGLSQLEAELGVELVMRTSRQFRLTDAGQSFFRAASKGIATVDDARDEIRRGRSTPHGLVRIAAPATFATTMLPPLLAQFVKQYPKVQIDLAIAGGHVDPLRDGFDIVLTTEKLADSSLKVRSIGPQDAGIFATAAYLAERGRPRRPGELVRHDCILRSPSGKKDRWRLVGPTGTMVVAVDGHLRIDDMLGAMAAAAANGGLVLLPLDMARMTPSTPLERVLPDWIVRGAALQLVYAAQRQTPLRVALLRDAILAHAQNSCPKPSKSA
jgi:DNA-binding transcriptional LysR family regulator